MFLQSKHAPHRIIYMNIKTHNMETNFKPLELHLIRYAMEDFANNDQHTESSQHKAFEIVTKIDELLKNIN